MSERRNGKIARLPNEVREKVNQMLEDGVTYPKIVEHLAGLGHKDVSEMAAMGISNGDFRVSNGMLGRWNMECRMANFKCQMKS
ncbi:hypothetical protein [Pedosphaera parvula]|uniref:Uncharacterized protein n=1 Tax=Pedosphaera parvula (strain Ellin514) TaxID=320771 RepID=B9XP11_PEDPL|nr:hypothetical protein [Pedosphaera parvula]EEF58477.1 hypothetical protein Cflav_PD1100 [Pedosphaera parvula Ellin514]